MRFLLLMLLLLSFVSTAQEADQEASEEQPTEAEQPSTTSDEFKSIEYDYVKPVDILELQRIDILDSVDSDEVIWLGGEQEQQLALVSPSTIGRKRGTAIIIPDWTESQFNAEDIRYLRHALNDYGWLSLALLPPLHEEVNGDNLLEMHIPEEERMANQKPQEESVEIAPAESEAESTADQTSEDAAGEGEATEESDGEEVSTTEGGGFLGGPQVTHTVSKEGVPERIFKPRQGPEALAEEQINAYQERLVKLMGAAYRQSRRYPGYFLIIAQGTSAAWLNKMFASGKARRPHAMVVLNPYLPESELNKTVAKDLALSGSPTLDLFSQHDNRWAKSTVADRMVAAKRYFKLNYRQRELFGLPGTKARSELMQKEIYGWLVSIGMM